MKKRVAVVGGRPAPIHGAKELNIDVVLIHEEGGYDQSILEHCETVVHADITDGAALIAALMPLHRDRPFDRIMTMTEKAGESTAYAVKHFGLTGVSEETARILKDKTAMRGLLALNDLSPVAFRQVSSAEEAADFVSMAGRAILKPADGMASLHIRPSDSAESAHTAFNALAEAGVTKILAEEYLDGPVVSVDSFSHEGRHLTIGYSQYRINDKFVEWEVSTPSSEVERWLPEIRDLTCRLLDVVGLFEGPSHSEFILTSSGPRVLESHARLAGSGAPELVRRVFGFDLNRMFLTVPLGIDPLPHESPMPVGGAVVQFFVPPPGIVDKINTHLPPDVEVRHTEPGQVLPVFLPFLPELRELTRAVVIQKHPGDRIPPLDTVADCVSGYVLVSGSDRADSVRLADELVAMVQFEMRSTP